VSLLLSALRGVAEHRVADVEKLLQTWLAHRDELEPVPAREVLERVKRGLVTVLDVRPAEEYAAGHLPGALNVPVDRLEKYLSKLPKRKEVVAYCRGPYCLMSFEAVAKLRKRGFKAKRLENGYPEWRAAGLPVER
jgi:rhodanese-related sulfurtransferase